MTSLRRSFASGTVEANTIGKGYALEQAIQNMGELGVLESGLANN